MAQIEAHIFLEFIENHLVSLKAGVYRFKGEQVLSGAGIGQNNQFGISLEEYSVKVAGERFSINPSEVASVFPPNNSLGHYANVLPHIALRRETLPWERMVTMSKDAATEQRLEKTPWMALLVLNPEEMRTDEEKQPDSVKEQMDAENGYVKKLSELSSTGGKHWPPRPDEGDSADEPIRVIYVDKAALQGVMPQDDSELRYLTHARQSRVGLTVEGLSGNVDVELYDEKMALVHRETNLALKSGRPLSLHCGELKPGAYTIKVLQSKQVVSTEVLNILPSDSIGDEVAVVVANRLPQPGKKTIVHLVSLEERFNENANPIAFDFTGYGDAVPLVSLYSWSFTSLTEKETFRHILLNLNHEFLFGMDMTNELRRDISIDKLRSGFLRGGRPLGEQAQLKDVAVKELRDKDHCYYVGRQGVLYDATGRELAPAGSFDSQANIIARIPAHRIHNDSAALTDCSTLQVWVQDGSRVYFLSEDKDSGRLLAHLLQQDNTPSLRLPERYGDAPAIKTANRYLQQGYAPVPHFFRQGGKSVSWYRGPLLPGPSRKTIPQDLFPVDTADELLRYHSAGGMFDASYAAAWELGRLLCLRNKLVSLELYRWKRGHIQLLKAMEQQHLQAHLPFRANAPGKIVLPDAVETWLSDISLLKGVPFQYLVSDEKMLPRESMRFFYIDPSWIACLIDGAMSIGCTNKGHDTILHKQKLMDTAAATNQICGLLIRSSVVKGWPNLQVNAYNYTFGSEDQKNLHIPEEGPEGKPSAVSCLRMERLSDDVLIYLFDGAFNVLDFHEKPETVHFGFNAADSTDGAAPYYKLPVKSDGTEGGVKVDLDNSLFDANTRRLKVVELFEKMKNTVGLGFNKDNFSSAQLALTLIEGVSKVRFIRA